MAENQQERSTRCRILAAAAELYAESGFEAVSLRAITDAAGANSAAIHYHFKGKDDLIGELALQHLLPINMRRLELLDELKAGKNPPTVRQLLDALFRPFVHYVSESPLNSKFLMKFLARAVDPGGEALPGKMGDELRRVLRVYADEMQSAVPGLTAIEAKMRMHFAFGSFVNTMLHHDMLTEICREEGKLPELPDMLEQVLDFCAAGLEQGGGK